MLKRENIHWEDVVLVGLRRDNIILQVTDWIEWIDMVTAKINSLFLNLDAELAALGGIFERGYL